MNLQLALHNHHNDIVVNTQHSITIGVVDVWQRTNKPQEPDFIAAIVLTTVPYWSAYVNALFSAYGIRMSVLSVFCHQTPKVKYTLNGKLNTCEVGDLLFVHFHKDKSGFVYRNALLYQAKMSSTEPYQVPNSERHQLELYKQWPLIEYVHSGRLNRKQRDVLPKMPHLGAQYLLIDDRGPKHPVSGVAGFPGTFPYGSCIASDLLFIRNELAVELFQFLQLGSGKSFVENNAVNIDGWSSLVWDLIEAGMQKAFNRKQAGYSNSPRISGWDAAQIDGVSFISTPTLVSKSIAVQVLGAANAAKLFSLTDEDTNLRNTDAVFVDENSGTSLIIIETDETLEV